MLNIHQQVSSLCRANLPGLYQCMVYSLQSVHSIRAVHTGKEQRVHESNVFTVKIWVPSYYS